MNALLLKYQQSEYSELPGAPCTHVAYSYYIFPTDVKAEHMPVGARVVARGIVPDITEYTQPEMIDGCGEWFGVEIKSPEQLKNEAMVAEVRRFCDQVGKL